MNFKCPFCGNQEFNNEQSFRAHSEWKHGKKLSGDLNRFKAPSYGLGSNSHIYERHAAEERRRQDDSFGSALVDVTVSLAMSSIFDSSSSSSSSDWSGGGGESGGGGASGDW